MGNLYRPSVFKPFPQVSAALSLIDHSQPDNWTMARSDYTSEELAAANREELAKLLGFHIDDLYVPLQTHGRGVVQVDASTPPRPTQTDALITNQPGRLLGVMIADCGPILVYDPVKQTVAAVHSGWRGTHLNVVTATIEALSHSYSSRPADLVAWVGPMAAQCHYEVGDDVASLFDSKYSQAGSNGKFMFDNAGVIYDQLLEVGVPASQIERDPHCSIHDTQYHSARREGERAGRMIATIGLLPVL